MFELLFNATPFLIECPFKRVIWRIRHARFNYMHTLAKKIHFIKKCNSTLKASCCSLIFVVVGVDEVSGFIQTW
jgi:hypothetical protein